MVTLPCIVYVLSLRLLRLSDMFMPADAYRDNAQYFVSPLPMLAG